MSAYRLKHYAFDLLALGDLIGQDAWSYLRKYLCLRSTVMYYDFDKVISAAPEEQKQPLTDLAIRLFDSVEKVTRLHLHHPCRALEHTVIVVSIVSIQLEEAAKQRSDTMTQACYADTEAVLKEVMIRMA
ncbi:hypothetical protein GW17_00038984 [Ensete ventricosum]|uniref:Uncharacterized protein n=1 Tax=Ensete ventricosum TaxID=4639 RepID=A0A444DJA0_ENSVE|nr:hypothetical protein B296_00008445 [Ensete ventricosum]RWV98185.1 hypothetical protein GW17_00038984 [Ensete ventricosum]RZR81289.1 hypothetical protein BHM03_00007491 [Ensete ventricosum]